MSSLEVLRQAIGQAVEVHLRAYPDRLAYARLDEKLLRDPIFGFQRLRPHEVLIADSPIFQRLRGIFQTSVAYLTYPSSIHTRFEHSINCLHLSDKVLNAIGERGVDISTADRAEVRMAALLHDVGHCIFSHGSEFFYREFEEFEEALEDPELRGGAPSVGELVNYCIITSREFKELLWEPIKHALKSATGRAADVNRYISDIDLHRVADRVIGKCPGDKPSLRFQTDVINGPLDVDKLDYLNRDSYFTGVSLAIDIDRLLPSLRVEDVENPDRDRKERRLVVDHRGIAVVEQLLFARMILYDTVYHHHKVRAATQSLQTLLKRHSASEAWPTRSKRLISIVDFLENDEYDFFGNRYSDALLQKRVRDLRTRVLLRRALVIAPRTVVDKDSYVRLAGLSDDVNSRDPMARIRARELLRRFSEITVEYARAAGAVDLQEDDVAFDIPEPPRFTRLGEETFVRFASDYVVPLKDLFPFQKVVNNYTRHYKYRSYVFASERWPGEVAYASYRALIDLGIRLNDLAFLLAHQRHGRARDLLSQHSIELPDWREAYYLPDATAEAEEDDWRSKLEVENDELRERVRLLEQRVASPDKLRNPAKRGRRRSPGGTL